MRRGVTASHPAGTETVAGWVLAGGRSTRMGRNKALLQIAGEPLLARIGRIVTQAAGSAVIIGDPTLYGAFGFAVIPDRIAGLGPLGGLLTALENTTAVWNLVVACDMPAVTASILEELLMHAETVPDARCVVPVAGSEPEPLCAVYHRDCLPAVRRAVEAKQLRMKDLVAGLDPVSVRLDPQVFDNINTPGEWSAYERSHG